MNTYIYETFNGMVATYLSSKLEDISNNCYHVYQNIGAPMYSCTHGWQRYDPTSPVSF